MYRAGKRQDKEKPTKSPPKSRKSSKAEKNALSHADDVPLREKDDTLIQQESEVSSQGLHLSPKESVESTVTSPEAILEEGQEPSLSISSNASKEEAEQPPVDRDDSPPKTDIERETHTQHVEPEEEGSNLVQSVMNFFKKSADTTAVTSKLEKEEEETTALASEKKKGSNSHHLEDGKMHEKGKKQVKKEQNEKEGEGTRAEEEERTAAPLSSSSSIASSIPSASPSSLPTTSISEFLRWKALLTAPYMIFDPVKNAIVSNPAYDRALAMRLSALLGKCSSRLGPALLTSSSKNAVPPSNVEEVATPLYAILEALHTEGLLLADTPSSNTNDASTATPTVGSSTGIHHPSRSGMADGDADMPLASASARRILMGSYVLSNHLLVTFLENSMKAAFFHPIPSSSSSKKKKSKAATHDGAASEDVLHPSPFHVLEWCEKTTRVLRDIQSLYPHIPTFRQQDLLSKEGNADASNDAASSASTLESASTTAATAAEGLARLWQELFLLYHHDGARSFFSASAVGKGKSERMERRVLPAPVAHATGSLFSLSTENGAEAAGEGGLHPSDPQGVEDWRPTRQTSTPTTINEDRVQELLCHTSTEKNGASAVVVVLTRPSTAVPWGLSVSVSPQGFCYLSLPDPPRVAASSPPSPLIQWIPTPSTPGAAPTSMRMWLDGATPSKLRVRHINYYPVPSISLSSTVASAEKKRRRNKTAPLFAKEERAWAAHEAAMTELTQDITTRLEQCTTVALELQVEKSHKRPKSSMEIEEEKEGVGQDATQATLTTTSATAAPDASAAAASSSLSGDTIDKGSAALQEEKALESESAREERTHTDDRMPFAEEEGEGDAPLVSDIPEEAEDDVGRGMEEAILSTAERILAHPTTTTTTTRESEKVDAVDGKAMEESDEGATDAVPRTPLVEGLQSLGELAEEVLSSASETKKSRSGKRISEEVSKNEEKSVRTTHTSSAKKRNATAEVEEESHTAGNAIDEKTTDEVQEGKQSASASSHATNDGAGDASFSSPLVFTNLVQLSDVHKNVVQFTRKDLGMPWKLNVCFTKGEVCMTKLPPAPPHALKHPFYQALKADKDGNVRWVIDAVNGKSIVDVPQSLKRKALETIKSGTTVSFALRGLRRL